MNLFIAIEDLFRSKPVAETAEILPPLVVPTITQAVEELPTIAQAVEELPTATQVAEVLPTNQPEKGITMSIREFIQVEIAQALSAAKDAQTIYNSSIDAVNAAKDAASAADSMYTAANDAVNAAIQKLAHFESNFASVLDQDIAEVKDLFNSMSEFFASGPTGPSASMTPTGPTAPTGPVMAAEVVSAPIEAVVSPAVPLTAADILNPQAAV